MFGQVTVKGELFFPHVWIEASDKIIDFKLRMWFGEFPDVPHGVFKPSLYDIEYKGLPHNIKPLARRVMATIVGITNYLPTARVVCNCEMPDINTRIGSVKGLCGHCEKPIIAV